MNTENQNQPARRAAIGGIKPGQHKSTEKNPQVVIKQPARPATPAAPAAPAKPADK